MILSVNGLVFKLKKSIEFYLTTLNRNLVIGNHPVTRDECLSHFKLRAFRLEV